MKSLGIETENLILGDSVTIEIMNRCIDLLSVNGVNIIQSMKRVIGHDHNDFVSKLG